MSVNLPTPSPVYDVRDQVEVRRLIVAEVLRLQAEVQELQRRVAALGG